MSSYLDPIRPYLPFPVTALETLISQDWRHRHHAKEQLFNTALAVVGYILAVKFEDRLGLSRLEIGALSMLAFSPAARLAVGGHVAFFGLEKAVAAGRSRDVACFAKYAALTILGYVGTTQIPYNLLNRYIYSNF